MWVSAGGLRGGLVAGAVILVLAVGILVPLLALRGLGEPVGRPPSNSAPASPEPSPVLDFEPAPGWHVRSTDPSLGGSLGVQAWAANVPFAEKEESPIGPVNNVPDGWPDKTEEALPRDGIVLVANYALETRNPLPPSRDFPERTPPLTIDSAPSVAYEGQDPDRALAVVNATVNGRYVTVRIVFGTGDPGHRLIRAADEELGRLIVAPPPTSTTELNDFGIRLEIPDPWHGILFRWPAGEPTLHAATVPVTDLYDGSSARRALGADDLFVVFSENYALAVHYEPVTLPVAIRPEDACPTCEILDDGTSPPPEHSLFYRSFAVGNRQVDLWAEFGTPEVTGEQLEKLNSVLGTLQIDPVETRPWAAVSGSGPVEGSGSVPPAPVHVDLPSGWIEKEAPVPGSSSPRVVAGFGTWDFPTGGDCGPEPALADLPDDGAFVWILEYADPGYRGDFVGLSPKFSIDLQTPPARWECADSAASRMYLFRIGGRLFEFHVALGPNATEGTIEQVNHLITSLRA